MTHFGYPHKGWDSVRELVNFTNRILCTLCSCWTLNRWLRHTIFQQQF